MKYDYQAMAFAASCQRTLGYQFTVSTPEKEHFDREGIKEVSGCRSLDIFLWNLKEKWDLTKSIDRIQTMLEYFSPHSGHFAFTALVGTKLRLLPDQM